MPIYQVNDDMAPDSDFEPGEYGHLVAGNHGRLLDARRTPVTVRGLRHATGMFSIRVEAFEDAGTLWEIPYEEVSGFQFARGGDRAGSDVLSAVRKVVERFDRPLRIDCDQQARAATLERIRSLCSEVSEWFDAHSRFIAEGRRLPDPETREGEPALYGDLRAFMTERGLWEMDAAFAESFVSNPYSGEMVKGHRIVLAELGLVPYVGKVVRDPGLLDGDWSRERRGEHILCRLAFVRSVLRRTGCDSVRLYRGASYQGRVAAPRNRSFVSATFSAAVAESHYESGGEGSTGVLIRQSVPTERLFMTYLETVQMSRKFREAEAVLLFEDGAAF
jgi:hypothetical protein